MTTVTATESSFVDRLMRIILRENSTEILHTIMLLDRLMHWILSTVRLIYPLDRLSPLFPGNMSCDLNFLDLNIFTCTAPRTGLVDGWADIKSFPPFNCVFD